MSLYCWRITIANEGVRKYGQLVRKHFSTLPKEEVAFKNSPWRQFYVLRKICRCFKQV